MQNPYCRRYTKPVRYLNPICPLKLLIPCRHAFFRLADADAVMKNPFYTPEMPINATGFDAKMNAIVAAAGP